MRNDYVDLIEELADLSSLDDLLEIVGEGIEGHSNFSDWEDELIHIIADLRSLMMKIRADRNDNDT